MGVLTVEWLVITAVAWHCLRGKLNLCLFLVFFYEVGVGLWDFLLQAGLGIAFRSENFVHPNAMESLAGRQPQTKAATFFSAESASPLRQGKARKAGAFHW